MFKFKKFKTLRLFNLPSLKVAGRMPASLLALLPIGSPIMGATDGYQLRSYVQTETSALPAFAWCEAKDKILALTQPQQALTTPRPTTLYSWSKSQLGQPTTQNMQLDRASQNKSSNQVTHKLLSKSTSGVLAFGKSKKEGARMPKIDNFQLGKSQNSCRHAFNAAFMGASNKHTVIVWDGNCDFSGLVCKATLATRSYKGNNNLLLDNGQMGYRNIQLNKGKVTSFTLTYTFESDSDGLFRLLEITDKGSTLTTRKAGQVLSRERFLAYSVSLSQ